MTVTVATVGPDERGLDLALIRPDHGPATVEVTVHGTTATGRLTPDEAGELRALLNALVRDERPATREERS
jgi:hypothetical protein